jgi:hypothetical protein
MVDDRSLRVDTPSEGDDPIVSTRPAAPWTFALSAVVVGSLLVLSAALL